MLNINGLYRHFKGGFYIVNCLALLESDPNENDPMVVYTSVETGKTWLRPLSQFSDDVSDREDNITGQTHRFELATEIKGLMSFMSTEDLLTELEKRQDNPYDSIKKLEEDEDVLNVEYLLGRIITRTSTDGEPYEEFIPIALNTFESYQSAKGYAESHFPNTDAVISRRVIRKCSE